MTSENESSSNTFQPETPPHPEAEEFAGSLNSKDDFVRERVRALIEAKKDLKTRLARPGLTPEEQIPLHESLRDTNTELLRILRAVTNKKEKPGESLQSEEEKEFREKLDHEFDRQLHRLLSRIREIYPEEAEAYEATVSYEVNLLKYALHEQIKREDVKEGHVPFVIVLRNELMPLEKQVELMEYGEIKGSFNKNMVLSELRTAGGIQISKSPAYLIVDIEDGRAMLGKSAYEAVKQFKNEGRSPLTAEEGVAFITQHPEILAHHSIDLAGSFHSRPDSFAGLWLSGPMSRREPELCRNYSDVSDLDWGSASCLRRV